MVFPEYGKSRRRALLGGYVGSLVMAGHVGPELLSGHVGYWGMVGDLVVGLSPSMLVPKAWRDLLVRA